MRIAALICRYLLGLAFTVFGLNGFLHFIPQPSFPHGSAAEHFFIATGPTGYMAAVFAVQLACGLAFLAGVFVPLTLIVVAPVLVNILLFHATMAPAGLPAPVVLTALWVVVAVRYRAAFAALLRPQLETPAGTVA